MKLDIQLFADAEVSIKFDNKVTGEGKLKKYAETLSKINSVLSGLNTGATKELNNSANNVNQINENVSEMSKKVGVAFNFMAITKYAGAIKKLGAGFTNLAKQSFDYLENFNLFQVAFEGNYASAEKFVNKMSEMYNLDESWVTQTVGKFKQLSNAMGLTAETGEKVSKLLTQMSLDISSLYNVDIDRAAATLSSAMAGQTKPIRGVAGGDITQATLQTTLNRLDIDRTVNQLSFAEKRLLIIISLTEQLKGSINDMGRTIESPSNQLRIMNEQWARLSRAVGNVFLPILAKILPYLNAILMVLTEIINMFANFIKTLLGFTDADFDFFDEASVSIDDFGDSAKGAAASVKKLKQGLRGFDKLNVITTPSTGGGAGGIGGGIGIDSKLLDKFNQAYKDYQDQLEKVETKASKIRDTIMEWLGFTKITDEETGKISFKFDHITSGTVLGALAVGGTIFMGVTKILGLLRKIGFLKFPVIENLFGKLFGGNAGSAADALNGAGKVGEAANSSASSFQLPSFKTVLKGLGELALIIGGLTALVVAIGELNKIPGFKQVVQTGLGTLEKLFWGLSKSIIPLTAFSAGIVALGNVGVGVAAKGLAAFAIIVAGLSLVVAAIGELTKIPGYNYVVEKGGEMLIKLGEVLGGFAGSIVGGFVGKSFKGIEEIGTHLTNFMKNAKGFFEGVSNVNAGTSLSVKLLAEAVLTLTATSIIDGIKRFGKKGSKLEDFGKELVVFGPLFSKYAKSVKDINPQVVIASSAAANSVAAFAKNIPNSGGVLAKLVGDNTLDKFGKQLEPFGKNFAKYSNYVKDVNPDIVTKSSSVASTVAEFAKKIPNSGGLWGLIAGDNDLGKFGEKLASFGKKFKEYASSISSINTTNVNTVSDAIFKIIENAKTIKNNGVSKVMEDFGKSLKNSADNISKFFKTAFSEKGGESAGKDFGKGIVKGIKTALNNGKIKLSLKDSDGKSTGDNYTFKATASYYKGGLPPVGQMFVANEKGPELIGHIGGQSFVANQNQVVDLLDRKLGEAKSKPINLTLPISVGSKEIAKVVIQDLQDMAKTNGKPITIGA